MQKRDTDNLKEYAEAKRPFDDVMRQLLQAKPAPRKAVKPKARKTTKPAKKRKS